jgi:hypothetical protein
MKVKISAVMTPGMASGSVISDSVGSVGLPAVSAREYWRRSQFRLRSDDFTSVQTKKFGYSHNRPGRNLLGSRKMFPSLPKRSDLLHTSVSQVVN